MKSVMKLYILDIMKKNKKECFWLFNFILTFQEINNVIFNFISIR